jgi:hypothetical protein
MRKLFFAILAGLLLCGQSPVMNGFPPGTFQNRAALNPASGGGGYTGPGDVTSFVVWGGLRAYSAAYAASLGNIAEITDTATGTTFCTVVSKSNGDADLTSLSCVGGTVSVTTFCTVTHPAGCSFHILYDQTGNGHNYTNATLANMPILVFSGLGSHPILQMTTSQNLATNVITQAQPLSMSMIAERTSGTSFGVILGATGSNPSVAFHGANLATLDAGSFSTDVAQTDNQWHSFQAVLQDSVSANTSTLKVDSTSNTPASGPGTNGFSAQALAISNGSFPYAGNFLEGGVAAGSISGGNQTTLCHQQFTYWGLPNSC